MKTQNELQAMHKDLLIHTVGWVQFPFPTGMKDRTHVLDLDKLSTYGQDDLIQSASVVKETLLELEFVYHSLH